MPVPQPPKPTCRPTESLPQLHLSTCFRCLVPKALSSTSRTSRAVISHFLLAVYVDPQCEVLLFRHCLPMNGSPTRHQRCSHRSVGHKVLSWRVSEDAGALQFPFPEEHLAELSWRVDTVGSTLSAEPYLDVQTQRHDPKVLQRTGNHIMQLN